jgi:hypothetical protein
VQCFKSEKWFSSGHGGEFQDAFNTKQQNLILVYSQVNATLQELPLLQQQLSQQLAGIA